MTLRSKRDIALNAILRGFQTPHAAAHVSAGTMVALSTLWRVQPYADDCVRRTTASATRNASLRENVTLLDADTLSHQESCRAPAMLTGTWLMFSRHNSIIHTSRPAERSRSLHFTTAGAGRSGVNGASDSMPVTGAAAALSCLAELVVMCGRGVDRWHGQPASRV